MKKNAFFLIFIVLTSIPSIGQGVKHISLNFSNNDFKILQDNTGKYTILSDSYIYFFKPDTLLPALPYIGYNVLISNTEEYESLSYSSSKSLLQSNVIMTPNPKLISTDIYPQTDGYETTVSYSSKTYPTEPVEFIAMNECDGYKILAFHVCPFEYDAIEKKLYIREHIDLDIHLKNNPFTSLPRKNIKEATKKTIKQIVVNPEDFSEQKQIKNNTSDFVLKKQTGFEYVIVTSNKFKDCFQKLANWKSRKGIRSKVLTVDSIVSIYPGTTDAEKIKCALKDIDGLSYVLLGGDTNIVPTCMAYTNTSASKYLTTPTDIYYSCLETINWDNNGNGNYADYDDNVSLIPSLNVSRAPISSIKEAQVFVNKIIEYESKPDTTNWKNDILMCGNSLGHKGRTWQPDYDSNTGQSDTEIWSQMIYENYIRPTWDGECVQFYDTYTDISKDSTYDFNRENFQEQLAKGYTFVNVMTHGYFSYWKMEKGSLYDTTWARNLTNNGYTMVITTACLTNAFDNYSLSRYFINNENSGIIAYLGTSRENCYIYRADSILRYLGGGNLYNALVYKYLFSGKYHRICEALTATKAELWESIVSPYYAKERKVWMGLNLMGDPEMPVYISKPKTFENVTITTVNDSIYVNAGTEDFDICFINQNDSTDYYIARNISNSKVIFNRLNGAFDICLTKPGYIPYITTCSKTYIQNMTLTGTNDYSGINTMIGSNVTEKVTPGAVVVKSGSTTVKINSEATITKDFEVKRGAEFSIIKE